MGYTQVALLDKVRELYPEVEKNHILLSIEFDDGKNAWIIKFAKGKHSRYAIIDKKDADECMDGRHCIYLGVIIDQYIKDINDEISGKA